ncbi:MAG: hypothetical protein OXN84_03080 [Albidovulum sp.]|nr:hypothetical protein [Albidovulum sp.]
MPAPIEQQDVNTPANFGNSVGVNNLDRGVEDHAPVPIYSASRLAQNEVDDNEIATLADESPEFRAIPSILFA